MTARACKALEEAVREALGRAHRYGAVSMSVNGSAPLGYPEADAETAKVLTALDAELARERRQRLRLAGEREEARAAVREMLSLARTFDLKPGQYAQLVMASARGKGAAGDPSEAETGDRKL